jgi:hypothetical protein
LSRSVLPTAGADHPEEIDVATPDARMAAGPVPGAGLNPRAAQCSRIARHAQSIARNPPLVKFSYQKNRKLGEPGCYQGRGHAARRAVARAVADSSCRPDVPLGTFWGTERSRAHAAVCGCPRSVGDDRQIAGQAARSDRAAGWCVGLAALRRSDRERRAVVIRRQAKDPTAEC